MNTELSLEVSHSSNSKILRLIDTSKYFSDQVVENYLIEVLPVNKDKWITFNVSKYFSLVLNSSNLTYKKAYDSDQLIDLPDGIYEFKQSYKPNIQTINHYYHLRVTELNRKIQIERCDLIDNKCNLSREEFIKERDKLRDIEEYLTAAKWMVEECLDKKRGKELYDYSLKLFEQYKNECQCK